VRDTLAPDLYWILGLFIIGFGTKWFFEEYLADITVYTTTDERSPYYKIRTEILREATRKLRWLLRHYSSVAVVGHSLGSVIGYDVINRLRVEAEVSDNLAANVDKLPDELADLLNNKDLPPQNRRKAQRLIFQVKKIHRPQFPFDPGFKSLEPLNHLAELTGELPLDDRIKAAKLITQLKNKVIRAFRNQCVLENAHGYWTEHGF